MSVRVSIERLIDGARTITNPAAIVTIRASRAGRHAFVCRVVSIVTKGAL